MRLFPARFLAFGPIARLSALLLAGGLLLAATGAQAQVVPTRYYGAQFLADAATEPPQDSVAWRSVLLPSRRGAYSPDIHLPSWYRIAFNVPPDSTGDWAMHIRELTPAAEIWLNGRNIAYLATPRSPETALRAYFVSFKADWLHPGTNELYLRIPPAADARSALSTVLIGPLAPVLDLLTVPNQPLVLVANAEAARIVAERSREAIAERPALVRRPRRIPRSCRNPI